MDNQRKVKFISEFLAKISAHYQFYQPNAYSGEIWLEGLEGLNQLDVRNALNEHFKMSKYAPTISEIRELALEFKKARYKQLWLASTKNSKVIALPVSDQVRRENSKRAAVELNKALEATNIRATKFRKKQ